MIGVFRNRGFVLVVSALALAVGFALLVPTEVFAGQIEQIGRNAREEVVGTVGQLFITALVCMALWLFWKRHYTEVMVTAVAAALVAWVVFSPDSVAQKLQSIVAEIFNVGKKGR
jgi:hypothetical protein